MSEIVTWLRRQLDEDEQVAREATYDGGSVWTQRGSGVVFADDWDQEVSRSVRAEAILHVVRMDPARVLAEVDAKRQRLDWIEGQLRDDPADETAQRLAKFEALPFATQPGYRAEWRP